MDLKKLRHAIALAEEGTFAAAAKRVHLSQPALSRSIQALEEDLGLKLFDRHPGGVWLTVPGQILLQQARDVLRSANSLRREAELIQGVKQGILSIGLGPVPSHMALPALADGLFEKDVSVRIHVITQDRSHLLELLLDESIELFVSHTHALSAQSRIIIEPIGHFQLGFFVRHNHPILRHPSLSIKLLHEYPLASHTFEDSRDYSEQATRHVLAEWPRQLTNDSILGLKSAMPYSDMILFTARCLVADEIGAGKLVPLATEPLDLLPHFQMGIVRLAGRSLSPLAEHVTGLIRTYLSAEIGR